MSSTDAVRAVLLLCAITVACLLALLPTTSFSQHQHVLAPELRQLRDDLAALAERVDHLSSKVRVSAAEDPSSQQSESQTPGLMWGRPHHGDDNSSALLPDVAPTTNAAAQESEEPIAAQDLRRAAVETNRVKTLFPGRNPMRWIHFRVEQLLPPRQQRRILSFLDNGFEHATLWVDDYAHASMMTNDSRVDVVLAADVLNGLPLPQEVAAERALPPDAKLSAAKKHRKPRKRSYPLRILALFGGWYFALGWRCNQPVSTFETLARELPYVMTYEFRSTIPSLDAMYFSNSTVPSQLYMRLAPKLMQQDIDTTLSRIILDEWNGVRVLLPRQYVLNSPDVDHFWNPGRPPTFTLTSRNWHNNFLPRPGIVSGGASPAGPVRTAAARPTAYPAHSRGGGEDDDETERILASDLNYTAVRDTLRLWARNAFGGSTRHPLHENVSTANFFWFDGELSQWAFCGVASFVKHGFRVVVWSYNPALVVPKGALVGDASIFYPAEYRMTITQKGRVGSLAAFSNMFRFRMLATTGGWYFDIDMVCLRPVQHFVELARGRPLVIGFQDSLTMNGAAVYVNYPSIARLCERRANETLDAHNRVIPWGTLGPQLWTGVVEDLGLVHHARAEWFFYAIPVFQLQRLFKGDKRKKALDMTKRAYVVHIWNEMMKDGNYPNEKGSFLTHTLNGVCTVPLRSFV